MTPPKTPDDVRVTVIEAGQRWSLPDFREIWRYRDLMLVLARRDIVIRYKQAVVGVGWAILQPLLLAGLFAFFLGVITGLPSPEGLPYGAFVVVGMVLWIPFSTAVNLCTLSTLQSSVLIEKVYFPRIMIPIAAAAPAAVDMMLGLVVALAVALGFGIVPPVQVVLAPLVIALALVIALGFGLLFSALNVRYRDITMLVGFVLLAGLFVTPITYPYDLFIQQFAGWIHPIYALNPMVGVLELFRWSVLGTSLPADPKVLFVPFIAAPVLIVAGTLYYERAQRGFADVI